MGSKSVQIPTPDGVVDAVVAFPSGDGPFPAVILYMDAFGVRPVLHDMADTIADDGFYVLLPNVFYRSGPAPLFDTSDLLSDEGRNAVFAQAMPMIRELTTERALRDAAAYLDFLAAQPEAADGTVGVTGYCLGGRLAVRTAAAFPDRIGAVASFHAGGLVTDEDDSPHLGLAAAKAEFYFAHAEHDHSMTPAQVAQLEEALDAAGLEYLSEVYEGTQHGFTMSDSSVYDPVGLERHWRHLLELFERRLAG
ncbi:dienelactone hydrolase family protein [Cryptosporangium phraense]|uniref:Dienelactone hydrolase family protein n=1 Tax=Cryptosporangium phraense TaxID=2593070 RepID=A0A545AMR1_9ACTN|nr:dienelactone hydrolase family protein [Cryptosporangium phraense]TQS42612.1 dienelactone hydrolase family protein [Cryptosporangium phraense]